MSTLVTVSATSIQEFALCERKFWITHHTPKAERPPPTESQAFGTSLHDAVETYLTQDLFPSDERLRTFVELAIPYLPPPKTNGVFVEQWIEMPTFDGGPRFVGKVDVIDARADVLCVTDHKSYKEKKHTYIDKAEELADTIQMASYGRQALTDSKFSRKDRSKVQICHLYYKTEGKPTVVPATTTLTRDRAEAKWQSTLSIVERMAKVANLPSHEDVTPSVHACTAYGGCPYQAKCGFETEVSRELHQIKVNGMAKTGLLSRVKNPIVPPDAPSRESSLEEVISAEAEARKLPEEQVRQEIALDMQGLPTEDTPVSTEEKTSPKDAPSFVVYVDCMPIHGEERPVPFELFVTPLAAKVAEENGVADIRFLKYGEGKPKLATAIRQELWQCPRSVLVSTMAQNADIFLDAIYPFATKIVRALRG